MKTISTLPSLISWISRLAEPHAYIFIRKFNKAFKICHWHLHTWLILIALQKGCHEQNELLCS